MGGWRGNGGIRVVKNISKFGKIVLLLFYFYFLIISIFLLSFYTNTIFDCLFVTEM